MNRPALRALPLSTLVALALSAPLAFGARIDPGSSHAGFTLTTRWGQVLQGRFPDARGDIAELPDGRHRVLLHLATGSVEIIGHGSYTRFTRGSGFFDAAEYPRVEFVSDPYSPALLRSGGPLPGVLFIRGIHHREVFTIAPATCAQPARTCDVVATGQIQRADYGMDRWSFALSGTVGLSLRVRVRDDAP